MRVHCGREGRVVGLPAPLWRLERVGRAAVGVDISGRAEEGLQERRRSRGAQWSTSTFIPSLHARDAEIKPAVLVRGLTVYGNAGRPFALYAADPQP
jgi:hypothetical protein